MGKARINSHLGNGLYFITYIRDVANAQKEVLRLEKLRVDLEKAIYKPGGYNDELQDKLLEVEEQAVYFNDASDAWMACARDPACRRGDSLMAEVVAAGKKKAEKVREYMLLQAKIAQTKADMLAASQRIAFLQNNATDLGETAFEAWCIDYPHQDYGPLAPNTIVGTIETYGARKSSGQEVYVPAPEINIQASFANRAVYDISRDHKIQPLAEQSVATCLLNVLEWLWVMAKKPTFEVGVLTWKDDQTNRGNVSCYGNTLVSGRPEAFPYDGGSQVDLNNIPFDYQDCHSKVFEVNDWVMVRYADENRSSPVIIGFAQNPKECKFLYVTYSSDPNGYITGDTDQRILRGEDGTPVFLELTGNSTWFRYWEGNGAIHSYSFPRHQELNLQISWNIVAKLANVPNFPAYIYCTVEGYISSNSVLGTYGVMSLDGNGGYTVAYCNNGNQGAPTCSQQGVIEYRFECYAGETCWGPGYDGSMPMNFGIGINDDHSLSGVHIFTNPHSPAIGAPIGDDTSFSCSQVVDIHNWNVYECAVTLIPPIVSPPAPPPNTYGAASGTATMVHYPDPASAMIAAGIPPPDDGLYFTLRYWGDYPLPDAKKLYGHPEWYSLMIGGVPTLTLRLRPM